MSYRDSGYDPDTADDLRWNTLWREAERIVAGDEPDEMRLARSGWTVADARAKAAEIIETRRKAAAERAAADAFYATACPTCGGCGQVQTTTYDFNAGYERRWTYCPSCGGTGKPQEVTE